MLDDNIALIEFKSFLDNTFKDTNEKGIKELVIDLRKNGGGNSTLGDLIVEYIYDGNYKSIGKLDIKISEEIIEFYKQKNGISEDDINSFKERIGDIYNFTLPNTKLSVGILHRCFVKANGLDTGKGFFRYCYRYS